MRRDLERTLLPDAGDIIFGPRIITWRQFVRTVADTDQPLAHRGLRRMALRQALADAPLKYFNRVRTLPGTIACFDRTVQAMKHGGCTPALLRGWFATRGGAAEFDLLHVYERYEECLQKWGIMDEGGCICAALSRIRAPSPPTSLLAGIGAIECVGFSPADPVIARLCDASPIPVRPPLSPPAAEPIPMEVVAITSPRAEISWIAQQCSAELSQGYAPEDIVIIAPPDHLRQRLLAEELALVGAAPPPRARATGALVPWLLDHRRWHRPAGEQPLSAWIKVLRDRVLSGSDGDDWAASWRSARGDLPIADSLHQLGQLNVTLQTLHQMETITRDAALTGIEFHAMVEELIGDGDLLLSEGGPRTLPFQTLPMAAARLLLVPNCVEGVIPPAVAPLPFCAGSEFRDEECALLRACLPLSEAQNAAGLEQWNRWRTMARNSCVASYPLIGTDGRDAVPAAVLPPQEEHLIVAVGETISPSSWERKRSTTDSVTLTDPAIRAHIGIRFRVHRFSVSQLERFAAAPFAFFCERVLGLTPETEESIEVKPKDRGTILHAILEQFVKLHGPWFAEARTATPDAATLEQVVAEIADQVIAEALELLQATHPALRERLRLDAIRCCVRLLQKELAMVAELREPLTPIAVEWRFGQQDLPPLRIDLPGDAPIELAGTIDRIDSDKGRTRFAIYDYKTGAPDSPRSQIDAGRHFQLPVYLRAVGQLLLPKAEAIGALLIVTSKAAKRQGLARKTANADTIGLSGRSGSLVTDEEWERLTATAERYLREAVAMIRRAEFPSDRHECRSWCEWRRVCGRPAKE